MSKTDRSYRIGESNQEGCYDEYWIAILVSPNRQRFVSEMSELITVSEIRRDKKTLSRHMRTVRYCTIDIRVYRYDTIERTLKRYMLQVHVIRIQVTYVSATYGMVQSQWDMFRELQDIYLGTISHHNYDIRHSVTTNQTLFDLHLFSN